MQKEITSVSQYLDIIRRLDKAYAKDGGLNNPVSSKFLYRGMAHQSWPLLPGIFRRISQTYEGWPADTSKYLTFSTERRILQHFRQEAAAFAPQGQHESDLWWVELAQHYSVPTRLLDWSENPLVALYFACEDNGQQEDAVVWMLNRLNYNRYIKQLDPAYAFIEDEGARRQAISTLIGLTECEGGACQLSPLRLPFLYSPYLFDGRMSAQSSWFMVWGNNMRPFQQMVDHQNYMKLPEEACDLCAGDTSDDFLYQYVIPVCSKQQIVRELDMLGINGKTLFPGLDGVGKHIERIYRFDYQKNLGGY
jgi:hypothetical protein